MRENFETKNENYRRYNLNSVLIKKGLNFKESLTKMKKLSKQNFLKTHP